MFELMHSCLPCTWNHENWTSGAGFVQTSVWCMFCGKEAAARPQELLWPQQNQSFGCSSWRVHYWQCNLGWHTLGAAQIGLVQLLFSQSLASQTQGCGCGGHCDTKLVVWDSTESESTRTEMEPFPADSELQKSDRYSCFWAHL